MTINNHMQLTSINLGQVRTLQRKNRTEQTGIFKEPVTGPIAVTRLGLPGDAIVSKKHHGGPDQALYIYGGADYDWWTQELGHALAPGTFGDNLTLSHLASTAFNIGDYLQLGEVTLQVTAPRIPCGTFAARMEDPQWVKKFRAAERPGLYCRVLQEGRIQVGDEVIWEPYQGETISVLEMYREYYVNPKSQALIERQLRAPIAIRARRDLEKDLRKLGESTT